MPLSAAAENIRLPESVVLIEELSRELAALYEVSDGRAGFTPEDVEVPRAAFVVARLDGVAVGCGAIRPLDQDTVEVKRMYTRKDYRRKGVAQAVLAELERLARHYNYTTIKLQTGPRQPEAAALYERVGYYRIPRFMGNWDAVLAYQKDIAETSEKERGVKASGNGVHTNGVHSSGVHTNGSVSGHQRVNRRVTTQPLSAKRPNKSRTVKTNTVKTNRVKRSEVSG
jgi:putative acetyltransferase